MEYSIWDERHDVDEFETKIYLPKHDSTRDMTTLLALNYTPISLEGEHNLPRLSIHANLQHVRCETPTSTLFF